MNSSDIKKVTRININEYRITYTNGFFDLIDLKFYKELRQQGIIPTFLAPEYSHTEQEK